MMIEIVYSLLRLENRKEEEFIEIYTKEELIELTLQMDFQQADENVRDKGLMYNAVEHPCIICHLKQTPEKFECNNMVLSMIRTMW